MCLILFGYKAHPKYPLVLAANRDEFYGRPTAPADFWDEHPSMLAGKDIEAGGTWMGVNTAGKLSMLTNYRDLSNLKADAPSRGHLVSEFLINGTAPKSYMEQVASKGEVYNGFNLIVGKLDQLLYYGNYQQGVHQIADGIHGLSNALLDTPWPKVVEGKKKLEIVMNQTHIEITDLFELLYDNQKAPVHKLPNTGVGLDKEKMLSPIFIKSENYGSRCSTVILVDNHGQIRFSERTYNTENYSFEDRSYQFQI